MSNVTSPGQRQAVKFDASPEIAGSALLNGSNNYIDLMQSAVLLLDDSFTLLELNTSAENLFGVSANQIAGMPVGRAWLNVDDYLPMLNAALDSQQPLSQHEVDVVNHNGPTRKFTCAVTPIGSVDRQQLLIEFNAYDAPQTVMRDTEMRALRQISDDMLRGFAHEVRNPLGGLRGAAQLLDRELPNEELREYTAVILAEADRLANLVNRMLTPNTAPEMSRVNVHEVLERVIALVTAELPSSIKIKIDYDPSIPDIQGDAELLIQGFLNLVRNGQQALIESGQPGQITLKTRVRRNMTIGSKRHKLVAQVDIIDDGPGVPTHLQQQIFYPLITGRAEGSGLGLPIAQSLFNQQGGLVNFTSEPGHTVFSVYLTIASE